MIHRARISNRDALYDDVKQLVLFLPENFTIWGDERCKIRFATDRDAPGYRVPLTNWVPASGMTIHKRPL